MYQAIALTKHSKMATTFLAEISFVIMSIVIPTLPAIITVCIIVGIDFIFGVMRTIKVDYQNRKKLKAGIIDEDMAVEELLSSRMGRTLTKLLGFTLLMILAGSVEYILKPHYEVPLIVGSILFVIAHELKSIDENFKGLFGFGFYTGFLKLLTREPLKLGSGKNRVSVEFDSEDTNPNKDDRNNS